MIKITHHFSPLEPPVVQCAFSPLIKPPRTGKGIMNPNLGILRNGTIVVGYLSEDHILNLEWVNLVQGIIWLVRDGKVGL